MKTILTAIVATLLILSCGETAKVTSTGAEPPVTQSSAAVGSVHSSSSAVTTPVAPVTPPAPELLFVAEIGYVCQGFNTNAVSSAAATEGYSAMYSICGDMATMTTSTQPRVASVLDDWMTRDLQLSYELRVLIVSDVGTYGSSLRFYNAVDGYLRYIYIEITGDGRGLMKKSAL